MWANLRARLRNLWEVGTRSPLLCCSPTCPSPTCRDVAASARAGVRNSHTCLDCLHPPHRPWPPHMHSLHTRLPMIKATPETPDVRSWEIISAHTHTHVCHTHIQTHTCLRPRQAHPEKRSHTPHTRAHVRAYTEEPAPETPAELILKIMSAIIRGAPPSLEHAIAVRNAIVHVCACVCVCAHVCVCACVCVCARMCLCVCARARVACACGCIPEAG